MPSGWSSGSQSWSQQQVVRNYKSEPRVRVGVRNQAGEQGWSGLEQTEAGLEPGQQISNQSCRHKCSAARDLLLLLSSNADPWTPCSQQGGPANQVILLQPSQVELANPRFLTVPRDEIIQD